MTLLSLQADLKRTNELLERIAVSIERAVGPVEFADEERRTPRRTEPQDIGRVKQDGAIKHLDRMAEALKAGRGK